MALLTRRAALVGGLSGSGLALSGCSKIIHADALTGNAGFQHLLGHATAWDHASQRALQGGGVALAKEFKPADISPHFKPNGTFNPGGDAYTQSAENGFADWRLVIDGLVARPMSLSLAALRALPARTQITRHDCVEGWSAIGQWTGVPLGALLKAAGVLPQARFGVFHCADNLDGEPSKGGEQAPGQYYESLGPADLFHPQTIIAYAMNGQPLAIPHGAPLRLRVERQLGYKHAKYLQRIQLVDSLAGVGQGRGGYWEDRGYEWYAGI
ncbi:MAG: molybdopterin-dependent oxidoreductase [Caulobacteraceae bacterium]|nr:molybdopterin-dependent oxidoreductase [Caulobacter sp.]